MTRPSWETRTLDGMRPARWASLCDGGGRCGPDKLEEADKGARHVATHFATDVSGTIHLEDAGASTHCHADYVRPRWARSLGRMDIIGHHIVCKLRPGRGQAEQGRASP